MKRNSALQDALFPVAAPTPSIPATWNYEESVQRIKQSVYKWCKLTSDMVTELWVAHEILTRQGSRTDLVANATKSWADYCAEVGIDRVTAWRWFARLGWLREPEEKRIESCARPVEITDAVDTIYCCDCLEGLRKLPDGLADVCVTSPPYWNQRDYGVPGQIGAEASAEQYIEHLAAVFDEVYRVLDPEGLLWLNLGDAKIGKSLLGIPWRVALRLMAAGWILRAEVIWHKPAPMPDGARDRPTRAHEQLFMLAKQVNYCYDADVMSEPVKNGDGQSRAFCSKDPAHTKRGDSGRPYEPRTRANMRDVWTVGYEPSRDGHAAAFPSKLIEPCVLAGSRPSSIVLDPFMGTGTVAVVAKRNGRHFVGFELQPEYCALAERRIETVYA